MNLKKIKRCYKCLALEKVELEGKPILICSIGFVLKFSIEEGKVIKPTPTERCYCPKTLEKLREAKKLKQLKK